MYFQHYLSGAQQPHPKPGRAVLLPRTLESVIYFICLTPAAVLSSCFYKWNYISCLLNNVHEPLSERFLDFSPVYLFQTGCPTARGDVRVGAAGALCAPLSSSGDGSTLCVCSESSWVRSLEEETSLVPPACCLPQRGEQWGGRSALCCAGRGVQGFHLVSEPHCFGGLQWKMERGRGCCSSVVFCLNVDVAYRASLQLALQLIELRSVHWKDCAWWQHDGENRASSATRGAGCAEGTITHPPYLSVY